MAQKIACGGFEIGDGLELNGKVLSASGGGGAGGMVVNVTVTQDPETYEISVTADKTVNEIVEFAKTNYNISANLINEVDGQIIVSVPLEVASSDLAVHFGFYGWDTGKEELLYYARAWDEDGEDVWEVNL